MKKRITLMMPSRGLFVLFLIAWSAPAIATLTWVTRESGPFVNYGHIQFHPNEGVIEVPTSVEKRKTHIKGRISSQRGVYVTFPHTERTDVTTLPLRASDFKIDLVVQHGCRLAQISEFSWGLSESAIRINVPEVVPDNSFINVVITYMPLEDRQSFCVRCDAFC